MFGRLRSFFDHLFDNVVVFAAIFLVALGFIFYFVLGRGTREALIEQILHREQVIARSGAGAIEGFLAVVGKSLVLLAKNQDIIAQNQNTQKILEEFIFHWEDTSVVEAIMVDKDGEIVFIGNKAQTGFTSGVFVADRDYFIASKRAGAGEIFMGQPLLSRQGAFQGQFLVPISTPIFEEGEFKGVLAVGILLSKLTNDYLDSLKISRDTEAYIVSSEGEFLEAPFKEIVGKNIFQQVSENPFLGSEVLMEEVKKRLERGGEGKIDIAYPKSLIDSTFKRRLIAYSPIEMGEKRWVLAITTPIEDALAFIGPFYTKQVAVLIIVFLAFIIYAVRVAKITGFSEGFSLHTKLHKKTHQEEHRLP